MAVSSGVTRQPVATWPHSAILLVLTVANLFLVIAAFVDLPYGATPAGYLTVTRGLGAYLSVGGTCRVRRHTGGPRQELCGRGHTLNSRAPRHIWAGTREKLHTQECELGLRFRAGHNGWLAACCPQVQPVESSTRRVQVSVSSGVTPGFEAGENFIRAALTTIIFGEPESDRGGRLSRGEGDGSQRARY